MSSATRPKGSPQLPGSPSAVERLAEILEMPADEIREAVKGIRQKRTDKMISSLMAKVALIRQRNTAILPTGEIVARGTPGAISYNSAENNETQRTASDG